MPLFHVEQVPGDHVTNETILEILGISGDQVNDEYVNTLLARSTSYPPLFCPPLSFLLSFPLSFPLSFSYSLSPLPSFCFNVVIFSLFPEFCILQLLRKHWLAVMKMPAVQMPNQCSSKPKPTLSSVKHSCVISSNTAVFQYTHKCIQLCVCVAWGHVACDVSLVNSFIWRPLKLMCQTCVLHQPYTGTYILIDN